jgi:hypothetical protein
LLYEAKVTDVKPNEGDDKKSGFQYKVHYKGWKNTYVLKSLTIFCLSSACCLAVLDHGGRLCPLPTLRPRGWPLRHHGVITHQRQSNTASTYTIQAKSLLLF